MVSRGGGRGRERVACCRGLSPEWLRGGSWWQETRGLRWDLSAEWSMLQTIYEGESSFSTTEGCVGHQQLTNHSKMHNVNNSGDHTARCFYISWGILLFFYFFSSAFQSVYFSLSLNLCLILCYLRSSVPPSHTFTLSLYPSFTLNSLRSVDLSFCVKRELKTSHHSNVVGSGTSSWIKVFTQVITYAALWIVFLHGTLT